MQTDPLPTVLPASIKRVARYKLRSALTGGKIARPDHCERCAGDGPLEAHHDDYLKPLEVRWLCRGCHLQFHAEHPRPLSPDRRPRGRPPTAAGPRPILITLRLYPHEHERLKRAAAKAGLTLAAYLRQA
jgi:hypothetical protein